MRRTRRLQTLYEHDGGPVGGEDGNGEPTNRWTPPPPPGPPGETETGLVASMTKSSRPRSPRRWSWTANVRYEQV